MITHRAIPSPLGDLLVVNHCGRLAGLYFPGHWHMPAKSKFGEASDEGFDEVARQLDEYFAGRRQHFDLPTILNGSPMQREVWGLISRVGYGETRSYGDLARDLDGGASKTSNMARAVGSCVGRNPISIVVPCHRIVGSDGKLTGYAGGRWGEEVPSRPRTGHRRGQQAAVLSSDRLFHLPRENAELSPGAAVVPDWLDADEQRRIVTAFREWCRGPVPLRAATLPTGHRMSAETVCLGWHWWPYRYSRTADDVNGARVLDVPAWLAELGRRALADTGWPADVVESYQPDVALANYYDTDARMGLRQDKEEVVDRPVVSLSVGDTGRFRFGNTQNRGKPYTDVELHSGDLLVFGGPSRFAFHGVTGIVPGTGPAIGLGPGRLNITLRMTGL